MLTTIETLTLSELLERVGELEMELQSTEQTLAHIITVYEVYTQYIREQLPRTHEHALKHAQIFMEQRAR